MLKLTISLAKNRREPNLKVIALEFIDLYKKFMNITTVTVKTAVKISEELKMDILERLSKRTGGEIELIEVVDEKLIGGFVVSVENEQYDASLLSVITSYSIHYTKLYDCTYSAIIESGSPSCPR